MRRLTARATAVTACAALGMTGVVGTGAAQAAASDPFLGTDGAVLRTDRGTGEVINLRGTNLGGWLTYEDWMSPLGEFAVDRSAWTASSSTGDADAAIDGSSASRWTTGTAQVGGEWLALDLGSPTLVNRLQLEVGDFAGDAPARYDVSVSDDGQTWTSVAADAASASAPTTVIRFTPQVVRHVRITQSATSSQWWSVAEVNAFSDPVVNSRTHTATASSSAAGADPARALDGDSATRWTSGGAQTPGQQFVVDLGANIEIGRVLIDSGAQAPEDYARAYEVWGTSDGASWEKLTSGLGTNRLIHAEFWTARWARYLKVVQTGSAANWWSIAEIAAYSGTLLERSGWSMSSFGGDNSSATIDGQPQTRWTTGEAQRPGQWLAADLGATLTFNNVTLDSEKNSGSEGDYPRGYRVDVSDDGSTWRTVAEGAGSRKATTIGFPAVSARHVRVVQTGTAPQWWSVGELTVALNNDDYSLRLSMQDRFGTATAQDVVDVHRDTWIQESDLDAIAALGLNTIRLPIGWNELLELDGTWKSDPWSKIDWLIAEAGERGLYVLPDLHTVPGGGCPWGSCGRMGPNPNGFWTNTEYQDWVVDIWTTMAERYEGNATVAGYDLINEPLVDYTEDADDVALKSAVYDRIYDAVRAVDPDHVIVLGAFFGWDALAQPKQMGWENVVYQLHPYDMPNGPDWNSQNALVDTQLADAAQRLTDPRWSVPILYGEYSLYHYDDVWAKFMAGLNGLDVSWTNWSYKVRGDHAAGAGGYWGLYNSNANPVPVINSDDAETYKAKLRRFSTDSFTPNERFQAVTSMFATGRDDWSPVPLDRSAWRATASSTEPGGSAARAVDGDTGTRWSSGQSQTPGQWLQIDLGTATRIGMVTIETGPQDRWDYARSFEVQVSDDAGQWRTVAQGPGFGWKRPITFEPTHARHIRIVQTGATSEWWSVAEVSVHAVD